MMKKTIFMCVYCLCIIWICCWIYEVLLWRESPETTIRIVCISDTHEKNDQIFDYIPNGDVLIHAGDFTLKGEPDAIKSFNYFMSRLPHKYKIVIAGNHELTLDRDHYLKTGGKIYNESQTRNLVVNSNDYIYLEDNGIVLPNGLKIWGSPRQPPHNNGAFQVSNEDELNEYWNLIPSDIDILITHGPPLGIGDYSSNPKHFGCNKLRDQVINRIKPKYHIFGHHHEGYGIYKIDDITFINAATLDIKYRVSNTPILFDMKV